MNLGDIYAYDFPETLVGLEKRYYTDGFQRKDFLPSVLHFHAPTGDDDDQYHLRPDASGKAKFDKRKPAFGWTEEQIDDIETTAAKSEMHEFCCYKRLKSMMLVRLICPDGAATASDLCGILRRERASGTPAPVPGWYNFSEAAHGPDVAQSSRRFGYQPCANRTCLRTESVSAPQFQQCAKCKLAVFCSRQCQVDDWQARHKKVCKEAKRQQEIASGAAAVIGMYEQRYGGV